MDCCYLHLYEGEQEIILSEDSILLKYYDESSLEEVTVNYSDIKNVIFSKNEGCYTLTIESHILGMDSLVEILVEEGEVDKLNKCIKICEKAYEIITNNHEVYYHTHENDDNGDVIRFYIGVNKEENLTSGLLKLGKTILLMGSFLVFVHILMNVINE